ncbi:MAG: GTP cyclohydrolase II [Pelagibacteraceae bacterium]|jgi:GTP cyclohydrolase II|nr:GTP cyclohydrolase II [Pelagibacteraceae bacterium]MDP6783881.1 GTP cyclohydrolase II [Alphaproteobacteria bacterium]MBO6467859.1 GTP cyclohydrolase II [Pelagibacteraceae bacterium]MBO6469875.1 GTP cyclohydrolase II [Pelagibacteraceae bacterium]MBO6479849.1 GTP cyclohydrolase II [Pelagibacteraceae bacterium]|tara:strand:- start:224 stop:817 length:594 start_codon:yes stop_codon:yes gene_type:complete
MQQDIIKFIETSELPSEIADFKVHAFTEKQTEKDHLAITLGDINSADSILARIHSQCITGESFFSLRCDCRFQLTESLKLIATKGSGVVFYLQQEGRGIGLSNKIRAYKLQDKGLDTVEANHHLGFNDDERNYEIVSAMANHLKIKTVDLMTNNPKKIDALKKSGLKVNRRIPIRIESNTHNKSYLNTKVKKLGHLM